MSSTIRRPTTLRLLFQPKLTRRCRPSCLIKFSRNYSLPCNPSHTTFRYLSHASAKARKGYEKTGSESVGASSGQADVQDFAFKYIPIDDVERLEKYQIGGYHPIAVGDTLKDGRYEIVDKLGHGGYSTIWLALDRYSTNTYVAVKICISDNTATSQEKQIIQKLLHADDKRASMILPILDEFVLDGPNGRHPCLVTPPARMSIAAAKAATHGHNIFPIPTARAIAAQLAQAVAFCHAQGVVHGDLHAGNILLRFAAGDDTHALSRTALYERFGEPYQEPVERIDGGGDGEEAGAGVPTHGVLPAWLGCRPEEVTPSESAILLADFGESYVPSSSGPQRTYCNAPLHVRPPEARFAKGELGFPADVWALACVIWEVFGGGGSLFGCAFFPSGDKLCQEWVHVLGRLPDGWWGAWDGEFRRNLFTDDGLPRPDRQDHFRSCAPGLGGRFEAMVQEPRREEGVQEVSAEEKEALLKMLGAILVYEPARRVNAEGVLCTEWMLRWGIPALDDLEVREAWSASNGNADKVA